MTKRVMYLLCFLLFACSNDKETLHMTDENSSSLTFVMTKSLKSIINNTQVYLFDGEGLNIGQFKQKVPDINYGTDRLTMSLAAGKWDFMLLSANTDISEDVIPPIRGQERSALKMWENHSSNGILPSMPELRTAYLAGQQVVANQANISSEPALLVRNAALVKIVIADAGGLDVSGSHLLKLTNVPTTLNWEGGLYPDRNSPAVSTAPMTGTFTVHNSVSQTGHQYSDTLRFIIPAHKGNDYLSASPADTTTSHLKISVDLACEGGIHFKKADIPIPRVPRVNSTLLVRLFLGGKLDVSAEILEWTDHELNADLSQTLLYTDKAAIGLAFKDTLHVNTNASNFTVEKAADASWITVRKLDDNAVEITADVNTYEDNKPRTSFITVKANNVIKKIPVTQRPDRGTIKVNHHKLIFCPGKYENRMIEVKSIGGDWKFLGNSPKVTSDVQHGVKGSTNVNFTRTSTMNQDDFDTYYGDDQIVVKNTTTLDTDTISLVNCYIHVEENVINAHAPTGNETSVATTSSEVKVWGGSKDIKFGPCDSWIHDLSWNPLTQALTMITDRDPDDEARDGSLTFFHADCPDYKIKVTVHQDIIVSIPAFDFFVVKFTWNGNDVDIAVEFAGNHVSGNGMNNSSYDKKPVGWGWSSNNPVHYSGKELIKWGGDATGGQGETVFFNAPVLEGDVNSPRKIKLDVYATWYTGGRAPDKMTFTMSAYKGGTMTQSGTNFLNTGGTTLYAKEHTVMVNTTKGQSSYASGGYTKVATITYDRIKHSAAIKIWAATSTRSSFRSVAVPFKLEEKSKETSVPVNTYSVDYKEDRK